MGEEVDTPGMEAEERNEFMRALLRDVRALERMLDNGRFETGVRRIGAEQEMFLVDSSYRPAPINDAVLGDIEDDRFVTELAKFNMEFNAYPTDFEGDCLRQMEEQLDECLSIAREHAAGHDADIALTGILPTIRKSDLSLDNMTDRTRYHALNEAMTELRGTDYEFNIKGIDEFSVTHDSVMLEAANTSFQIHFQVEPDEFATLYNIAQVTSAPVLALSTFSPLLFGKRLWHETRIALFQQSIDTRTTELHHRELEPRVTFGNDWIEDSVLEVYKQDIARFRLLFGVDVEEDPFAKLDAGETPNLDALSLHNGTVYRWNRACYGVSDNGKPHLRIENRVMPSGPTPVDEVANAAFWFGLMSGFLSEYGDPKEAMEFNTAKTNFFSAAREGISAPLTWMDGETYPAADLIQGKLLPLAAEGLQSSGIDDRDIERYLSIIDRRIQNEQTGSQWMLRSFQNMDEEKGLGERLAAVTRGVVENGSNRKPVAEWSLAELEESIPWEEHYLYVSQYMMTDFFTVNEDQIVDLVTNVMNWEHLRHVPVEDTEHRLVGLVTHRTLLQLFAEQQGDPEALAEDIEVADVMLPADELFTVTPETTTLEAIQLMREKEISALPVVANEDSDKLVGLVTETEFMDIARALLTERLEGLDEGESDDS
jgi:CBS domain-containing protein